MAKYTMTVEDTGKGGVAVRLDQSDAPTPVTRAGLLTNHLLQVAELDRVIRDFPAYALMQPVRTLQ